MINNKSTVNNKLKNLLEKLKMFKTQTTLILENKKSFFFFFFLNITMDNIDGHSKTLTFEKLKDLLFKNYTIEINKNKADSGSNNVGLSQFLEHLLTTQQL